LQEKAGENANALLERPQVHDEARGANFGTQGIIKKHVGDLVANSTLKEFQQATSEAYSKKVRDTPLCVLSIC
jgi:hypothetical protein